MKDLLEDEEPVPEIPGYTDLTFLDEGGMGRLYKAKDEQFGRSVVLKFPKDERPRALARFRQEAWITGRLQHPGIVPVYELKHDNSGTPFYVMRFVEDMAGRNLAYAIAQLHREGLRETLPQLRRVIRSLIAVSHTVDYAHEQGVLHLDIKPTNILVSSHGETLVLDWGLAGQVEITETEVAAGPATTPCGTPAYRAPEQRICNGPVDRRTDVFLLGSTLYHCLYSSPPFFSASDEGKAGGTADPREPNFRIPRPLRAICRKAMETRPEDRYPSAATFAEDLDHWLEDRTVTAYAEPIPERIARWARGHRTLSRALFLTVLAISLVSFAASILVSKKEKVAARNLRHAVSSADLMVQKLATTLKPLAGTKTETVRDVLSSARSLYNTLVEDAGAGPEVLVGQGRMLTLFSEVYLELGLSDPSREAAERAVTLYRKLVREDPEHPEWRGGLAQSHERVGIAHVIQGTTTEALIAFEAGRQSLLPISRRPGLLKRAASIDARLGDLYTIRGNYERAQTLYRDALSKIESLREQEDLDPWWSVLKQIIGMQLDWVSPEKRDPNPVGKLWYQTIMRSWDSVSTRDLVDEKNAEVVALNLKRWQAVNARDRGACEDATRLHHECVELAKRHVDTNPNNGLLRRQFLTDLILKEDSIAVCHEISHSEIVDRFYRMLEIAKEVEQSLIASIEQDPRDTRWLADRSRLLLRVAVIRAALLHYEDRREQHFQIGEEAAKEALTIVHVLRSHDPHSLQWVHLASSIHQSRALIYAASDRQGDSSREWLEAERILESALLQLVDRFPRVQIWSDLLASSWTRQAGHRVDLAELEISRKENLRQAKAEIEKAITHFGRRLKPDPDNPHLLRRLIVAYSVQGTWVYPEGNPEAVEKHRETLQKLTDRHREIEGRAPRFGSSYVSCSASSLAVQTVTLRRILPRRRGYLDFAAKHLTATPQPNLASSTLEGFRNLTRDLLSAPTREHATEASLVRRYGMALTSHLKTVGLLSSTDEETWNLEWRRLREESPDVCPLPASSPLRDPWENFDYPKLARICFAQGLEREFFRLVFREAEAAQESTWVYSAFLPLVDHKELRRFLALDPDTESLERKLGVHTDSERRLLSFLLLLASSGETPIQLPSVESLLGPFDSDAPSILQIGILLGSISRWSTAEKVFHAAFQQTRDLEEIREILEWLATAQLESRNPGKAQVTLRRATRLGFTSSTLRRLEARLREESPEDTER